jgi:regulator of sirC expression with transglutaminase-like and TPR domain
VAIESPLIQKKIEEIIHDLQFQAVLDKLLYWKQGGAMDLLEGFWGIATYQYPDLSIEKLRQEIEQLYYEVWLEIRPNMTVAEKIRTINSVLFNKLKFGANTRNFHSANNSMINAVIESRKGNPISLCAIYLIIGQRFGLPLFGVNLPSLFVLTYKNEDAQFYINVFNKGIIFSKPDIDNHLAQLNISPDEKYYQPCSNLDIILRVLRNLMVAFEKSGDEEKMKEIEYIYNHLHD